MCGAPNHCEWISVEIVQKSKNQKIFTKEMVWLYCIENGSQNSVGLNGITSKISSEQKLNDIGVILIEIFFIH